VNKELDAEFVSRVIVVCLAMSDEVEDFDIKPSQIERIVNLTIRAMQTDHKELLLNSMFKWNQIERDSKQESTAPF